MPLGIGERAFIGHGEKHAGQSGFRFYVQNPQRCKSFLETDGNLSQQSSLWCYKVATFDIIDKGQEEIFIFWLFLDSRLWAGREVAENNEFNILCIDF